MNVRSEYREILADGDLILQRKSGWLFGSKWINWRNLDEEVRVLGELKAEAYKIAHEYERLEVIAKANIRDRKDTLSLYLLENSDAEFHTGVETSILEQREGVKYNFGKGKGHNGGGNNQNQGGKGNGQNNNQNNNNKGKGQQGGKVERHIHIH